jgi:hypothetical protein
LLPKQFHILKEKTTKEKKNNRWGKQKPTKEESSKQVRDLRVCIACIIFSNKPYNKTSPETNSNTEEQLPENEANILIPINLYLVK